MKNLVLLFLLLPCRLMAQTDTQSIIQSEHINLYFDTTWNHSIIESDLILYVEIQKTMMVTQAGIFEGKILQVVKGEYSDTTFSIYLELIEFSRERSEKRLAAICPPFDKEQPPYRCYLGFKKDKLYYYSITDSKTKRNYYFFMSEKDLTIELKNYLFNRFLPEILLNYWGFPVTK